MCENIQRPIKIILNLKSIGRLFFNIEVPIQILIVDRLRDLIAGVVIGA